MQADSDTLETPPGVLQQHAEMLATDEPVQRSDRMGIYDAERQKRIADFTSKPKQEPVKPKPPEGLGVVAPMGRVGGGRWGVCWPGQHSLPACSSAH